VTAPAALVFGVSGQDGPWVARELDAAGYVVHGTHLHHAPDFPWIASSVSVDLSRDDVDVHGLLKAHGPRVIVFLAGRSSVAGSWNDPAATMAANVASYARVLEAVAQVDPSIRLVHASSSEMFGQADAVITEETPLRPNSPYAESKAMAHGLGVEAREKRGMNVANAILFNHESVRRPLPYVFRRISVGTAALSLGLIDELVLGDLDVVRDWGHAPDYARAVGMIARAPAAGDFVVATGVSVRLRDVVEAALASVGLQDRWDLIRIDPALARSGSSYAVRADPTHIHEILGWKASQSAADVISLMVSHDLDVLSDSRQASDLLSRLT